MSVSAAEVTAVPHFRIALAMDEVNAISSVPEGCRRRAACHLKARIGYKLSVVEGCREREAQWAGATRCHLGSSKFCEMAGLANTNTRLERPACSYPFGTGVASCCGESDAGFQSIRFPSQRPSAYRQRLI